MGTTKRHSILIIATETFVTLLAILFTLGLPVSASAVPYNQSSIKDTCTGDGRAYSVWREKPFLSGENPIIKKNAVFIDSDTGNAIGHCDIWDGYEKSDAFVNFHNDRAQGAGVFSNAASMISCAVPGPHQSRNCLAAIAPGLTGDGSSNLLSYISIGVGLVAGGAFIIGTGGFGAAVIGSIMIVGGGAGLMSNSHQQIANDPPDPNFQEVYQYSNTTFLADYGLGPEFNFYMSSLIDAQVVAWETLQGTLTSIERLQGAAAAGDIDAFYKQLEAAELFSGAVELTQHNLGVWIEGLPHLLKAIGGKDIQFHEMQLAATLEEIEQNGVPVDLMDLLESIYHDGISSEELVQGALRLGDLQLDRNQTLFSLFNDYGTSLQSDEFEKLELPPLPESQSLDVPEPTALALMGLGLAGIGYQRRRSKKAA